ncbi:unnamed protein product [Moneuplotes crassus]|uniref:Uncharacterized protein n=1 Tax=Euplotes crassus TaxID=5936 RepID=A0AAD1Y245_EUPCR|nr:unnamed protein product [Moneuplotes crassus]
MEDNIFGFFGEMTSFRKDVVHNPYEPQQEDQKPKHNKKKNKKKGDANTGLNTEGKPRLEIKDTKKSYIDLLEKLSKAGSNAKNYTKPKEKPNSKGEKNHKVSQFKQQKNKRNKIKKWKAKLQSKNEDTKQEE